MLQASAANAEPNLGRATVIDGETIEINGELIRLVDIDAPEREQTCSRPDDTPWEYGERVAYRLNGWIGERTVTCDAQRKDQLGRWACELRSRR